MNDFEKALQYVRENVNEIEVSLAIDKMDKWRCPLAQANCSLADRIYDLMEEYGEDNDLPEGWWLDDGDLDDIIFEL